MTTHFASPTAPGTVIGGRYSLRAAVGHGGMGAVWRATDVVLQREVAVKEMVLPTGLAGEDRDAMHERTLREARAAAALSHPSVVQVFDVVTEDNRPWIVMELLDARSLADVVLNDGPCSPRAVAKIGIALLGALEVAHAHGVLHRDVKPANVLLTNDGRCVLTDFGVAKLSTEVQLTTPGMVLGSPHFISPERALGKNFGPPSDLFSLGVTLYTAVEGVPPFDRGDPLGTMHAVVEDPPATPVRCGPLAEVLYGLMEKDPARRWDVPAARNVLRELLAGPLAGGRTSPAHVTAGGRTSQYSTPPPAVTPPPQPSPDADTQRRRAKHATTSMPLLPAARAGLTKIPRKLAYGISAGLAATVLVAAVAWAVLDRAGTPAAAPGSPAPSAPSLPPSEPITHEGATVHAPVGWTRAPAGTFLDLVDPEDSGRWLRINVTDEKDAMNSLQAAERGSLKKFCAGGYERVSLAETDLGGQTGAQLEFLCQPKDKPQRHGIWTIVVIDDAAYHVYLHTWDETFEADKPIYDQARETFTLPSS